MGAVQMTRVPEPTPNTRTAFVCPPRGPCLTGGGDMTYACAGCGRTLLEDVSFDRVRGVLFKCEVCDTFNDVPEPDLPRSLA